MDHFDQIVVGGGLAGSVLVYQLTQQGQHVCWIHKGQEKSSTAVAAGLINPLVFRYLTSVWKANELLPEAVNFYQTIEEISQRNFLHPITIAKVFGDQDEAIWQQKMKKPEIAQWIDSIGNVPHNDFLFQPFGAGFVQGYWLDTVVFLEEINKIVAGQAVILSERFDLDELHLTSDGVTYKNRFHAKKLIFCEGWQAVKNPFFDFVPFRPVKGELLTLKIENLNSNYLLNKDVFLLPLGHDIFRLGSTYDWNDLSDEPTKSARANLLTKLASFLNTKVEVIDHQVGVRPAIADRRPVSGVHPDYPQLAIFNGLGARGVMIAPWLGKQFLELLLHQKPLNEEIDLNRFVIK
ncbi:MAG: FAD-dependent oxidoreductase [Bacteroidales bacterium]|nr:FAD-dependent oxidoreductase [Bacteroidales bacterium]